MSQTSHQQTPGASEEHGMARSYIIGFILSLIFTAIPYYLVVNKSFSSSMLLVVILAIAVLQMLIQIFFFLHLGRGPKPLYNIFFFAGTVVTILVVVGGSLVIMNNLHHMEPADVAKKLIEKEGIHQINGEKTGACQGVHHNHKITIENDRVTPVHIEAQLCDTLTFINKDSRSRELTYGSHHMHGHYGGESELTIRKNRNKTITLNEPGTYQFHDHSDPRMAGSFNVTE